MIHPLIFSWSLLISLHLCFFTCGAQIAGGSIYPVFPLQLSADIEITAHLIDADSEYPPRIRRMSIHYDYLNKLARADIEEGYEAAKTYIRRYDTNNEYMVRHPPIGDCKRSYLGEVMPFPDIPQTKHVGETVVDGVVCDHHVHTDHDAVSHIYIAKNTGKPVQLTQSTVDSTSKVEQEVLTYRYLNVVLGPPAASLFALQDPHAHQTCERTAGGFPYLHVFHYFVRF